MCCQVDMLHIYCVLEHYVAIFTISHLPVDKIAKLGAKMADYMHLSFSFWGWGGGGYMSLE